ncbi:MAG: heme biosynthesis HemY N-terminal domain-containing protein [Gammaproteobacteria bacterium]
MRFILIVFGGLFVAILLGELLTADSGRVVFTWGGWLIHTSVAVFICVFVLGFIICSYACILLLRLLGLPRDYSKWRQYRRQYQAEKYLNNGMLAMVEGDWRHAENAFRKGAAYSNNPVVNYLGAARAAQLQDQTARRDRYLRLAHDCNDKASVAVALTQAELQLGRKQYEQAGTTLKKLAAEKPRHNRIKVLLLNTTAALKEWRQVVELLQRFGKKGLLPEAELNARQVTAYAGLLQEAGETLGREQVQQVWQAIPSRLRRRQAYLLETYVKQRLRFGDTMDCEPLLRKAIKQHPEPELVRLYGLVDGKDSAAQLDFMQKILTTRHQDPVLLLTLGRLSRKNNLWGKARAYLEESIAVQAHPETYQELAQLLEQEGDLPTASRYYREGLAVATQLAQASTAQDMEGTQP